MTLAERWLVDVFHLQSARRQEHQIYFWRGFVCFRGSCPGLRKEKRSTKQSPLIRRVIQVLETKD